MKQEIHLFILWENARYKQDEIIENIKKNLKILNVYEIEWSKEKFSNNLSRFYGTNLPKGSGKEVHCGNGKFLLIIVQDCDTCYEERITSKGTKIVNKNIFDKKEKYREWTGGGHKVHATNDEKETNHDLTLLLGKNIKDYLKDVNNAEWNKIINEKKIDLFGAEYWKSVEEMFYALNNCVDYAILRNFETFPDEIYQNDHNDIDLICESKEDVAYVLNAINMHEEEYRVQYKVMVGDKIAYFDLRYICDGYYYNKIEKDILKNRVYNEKGFFILEKSDYFYTLMYHALIQKPVFKDDYKEKLMNMHVENVNMNTTIIEYANILKKWMIKNEYIIVEPNDKTVYFNKDVIDLFKPLVYREKEVVDKIIQDDILFNENLNLKNYINELENQLSGIKDSRTWKIMEPLRKIFGKIKHSRKD